MKFEGYYVLHLNPLTVAHFGRPQAPRPAWLKPGAVVLEHTAWFQGYWLKMLNWRAEQSRLAKQGIEHHLIMNDPQEERRARRLGVRGALISNAVYIDETVFSPNESQRKDLDAVYIAKLASFKRHALAARIMKLAIITMEGRGLSAFCPAVAHAETNSGNLTNREVAEFIRRSHCTLALSATEGGMLASFESLLCGVPVISTPSRGGRHLFYRSFNSQIVEPDAEAIAAAVADACVSSADTQGIRSFAISDLSVHREKYCEYISKISNRHEGEFAAPDQLMNRIFAQPAIAQGLFVDESLEQIPETVVNRLSL
ncbi:MAG: glycosyltransferase [Bdellovibrionales bacterium]|nr:glycosyltransferase [Bdellovibrionales bacterium]